MKLLDTNHMTILRNGGAESLRLTLRLSAIPDDEVVTCVVVYEEQMRGWLEKVKRMQAEEGLIRVYQSLQENLEVYCGMTVLPFNATALIRFNELKKANIKIGTPDLKIAAIALAHDATVLTRNTRHFSKIPGLKFEDWAV